MGRPRKPTHLLELSGAFRRNPSRRKGREGEPKATTTLREPPAALNPVQRAAYLEIEVTAPAGLLCRADSLAVELLAVLLSKYRDDPDGFSRGLHARLSCLLAKLGMTPVDRTRLGA